MAVSAGAPASGVLPTPLLSLHPSKILNFPHHQPIITPCKKPLGVSALSSNLVPTVPSSDPSSHVSRLCLQDHLEEALLLLFDSAAHQELDEEAYVSLLRLCESKRAAKEAYRVHAHLDAGGRSLSIRLGNVLLDVLAKFGDIRNARKVFDEMPQRDTFSWNAMLGAYVKLGFPEKALELYDGMLRAGERPNVYTFPCVLKACGDAGNAGRTRAVHSHVLRFGYESHVDVLTALSSMYLKCGDTPSARKVFVEMPSRDQKTWRVMVSGYLKYEKYMVVLELFRIMRCLSVIPDSRTMTGVIKACRLVGDESLGKELHGYVARTAALGGEVSVQTSLIKMYFSFGDEVEAEKVFLRMPSKDLLLWSTMVLGYERNGLPEDAIRVYQEMETQGLVPDKVVIMSVLCACASTKNLELGTKLHELARSYGLLRGADVSTALIDMYSKCHCVDKALEVFKHVPEKDVVAWTSMIVGLRVNGRDSEALNLFQQMESQGLVPDRVLLMCALSACASTRNLELGTKLRKLAVRYKLLQDATVRAQLIDMYSKCYCMDKALEVFEEMPEKDVLAWISTITGLGVNGRNLEALNLFRQMPVDLKPNPEALVAALSACSKVGALMCGKEIHAHALRRGLAFQDFLQNALLDLYAKCGAMDLYAKCGAI